MISTRTLLAIIILILVVGGLGWFLYSRDLLPGGDKGDKASGRSAVFLTNGQVYFGKLSKKNSKYLVLTDIFYLQLAQSPQPEGQQNNANNQNQQNQVSLVKLGSELHGPVDRMEINREQVLFIEEMKEDSKVIEAIERYEKEGPTPVSSQAPTTQTQASASPSPR